MKKILLLSIFLIVYSFNAKATTYYSTSEGEWTGAIWSTVGHNEATGLVSLPCVFSGNDVVRIAHNITSSCGMLDLGTLTGNTEIILDQGSQFTIHGDINLKGTHMTYIQPSSILLINGNLNMFGTSDILVEGSLFVNGDVNMTGNSQVCGTGFATYTGVLNISGSAVWCSALPIELLAFEATLLNNNNVELKWLTETENNNDFFTIERSHNGEFFEAIATIKGAGTSYELQTYHFTDLQPFSSQNNWIYYRLKQTDFDGLFTYSNIITVENRKHKEDILVYPNPVEGQGFHVNLNINEIKGIAILYNPNGKVVLQQQINANTLYFDTFGLTQGFYILTIQTQEGVSSQKVTLR